MFTQVEDYLAKKITNFKPVIEMCASKLIFILFKLVIMLETLYANANKKLNRLKLTT